MKVRAKLPANGSDMTGVGYYDLRLFKGGEEFELSDPKHFSEKWMEKIEEPAPVVQFVAVEVEKDEPTGKKKRSANS